MQALLPFPSALKMMASDINWTSDLGNAFLAQQQDVMDAVQKQRLEAGDFGYLRSSGRIIVGGGALHHDYARQPGFHCRAILRSGIVFFAPRPGFVVGGAIRFGFGVSIGGFFAPWGWGLGFGRFDWGAHTVFIKQSIARPPSVATWNWQAAKASVAALARVEPRVLASGHGIPMTGAGTARDLHAFADRFSGGATTGDEISVG